MAMLKRVETWAKLVKRDIFALYLAARDRRVPWYAKLMALVTVAYALSPIDLIPDFIPIFGYLDDLIIVPAAIFLTIRLIPKGLMIELRKEASLRLSERLPRSRVGAAIIIILWMVLGALLFKAMVSPKGYIVK